MVKVSILIPLYNAEQYISQTIQSALDQTYENIEIIIVDDGSTDNSLAIVRNFEKKFNNIIVNCQLNNGASIARNKAFELSNGEYIQYLDADDILHKDKIYNQIKHIKDNDTKTLLFGKCGKFQNNLDNSKFQKLIVNKNYLDSKRFLIDLWFNLEAIYLHSWIIHRDLISSVGKWDGSLTNNDDGDFFARVVSESNEIIYVDDSIVYYRTDTENSLSKGTSEKSQKSNLKSYDTYLNLMKDQMKQTDVSKALAMVYSNFIYNIYPEYKVLINEAEEKIRFLGYRNPFFHKKRKLYYVSKIVGFYNALKIYLLVTKLKLQYKSWYKK